MIDSRNDDDEMLALRSLVAQDPNNAKALHNLGVLHDRRGQLDKAANYYREAIAADPSQRASHRNLASLLLDVGEHAESRAIYRSLIEADPDDVDAHYAYSKLTHYERSDSTLNTLQILSSKIDQLPPDLQIKLCFTVGKANQDLGEYDAAFNAFKAGNDLHYKRFPYDEASNFAMLDDVCRCFDKRYFDTHDAVATEDKTPIFVLGMPRSGSTLVEQILSSHSAVAGGGELKYLKRCIQTRLIRDKGTFSKAMPAWTMSELTAATGDYLRHIRAHTDGSQRVVDKMPGNFAFAGLIRQLLPHAKIIHTVRHPMATIWSNYSTLFDDTLYYTYDLDVLTRYFAKYRAVMTHWKSALPAGAIYDLRYEELVRNPEATLKSLLRYLELPWEPGCLDFHRTAREIKTASTVQVRQPLYSSAIDMWRNYRRQLRSYEDELALR